MDKVRQDFERLGIYWREYDRESFNEMIRRFLFDKAVENMSDQKKLKRKFKKQLYQGKYWSGSHVSDCGRFAICKQKYNDWAIEIFTGKTDEDRFDIFCWKVIRSGFYCMKEARYYADLI